MLLTHDLLGCSKALSMWSLQRMAQDLSSDSGSLPTLLQQIV
jgi:hypothetical protein